MTDQELKDLIASLAVDTQALKAQFAASRAEADEARRQEQEERRKHREMLAEERRKTEEERRKTEEMLAEERRKTEEERRKTEEELRRLSRDIREQGKQIGGIHAKFGKFAEGLAMNSMMRIVQQWFDIDKTRFEYNVEVKKGGKICEFDALAISNGANNTAVVLEVKSTLNDTELDKMRQKMQDFRAMYPEHAGKKLYGIVVVMHSAKGMEQRVLDAGFYLARMSKTSFTMNVPQGFVGREF